MCVYMYLCVPDVMYANKKHQNHRICHAHNTVFRGWTSSQQYLRPHFIVIYTEPLR